ncbi:hypothetical protein [Streptomyces sp. YGL11-2]|uniref:hypothetical protein n=1 Tax=Streptomyces sp. YGL11-2 TaxID=3414028 RepID=UPI003CE98ACD
MLTDASSSRGCEQEEEAAKAQLNDRQMEVLRWIAGGCPAGTWGKDDFSYKTSAQALQNRGLVKVSKRGGGWSAESTVAGRHYLEHGTYPFSTAGRERNPRNPEAGARSTAVRPDPPQVPAPGTSLAAENEASTVPPPKRASGQWKKTLGEQLLEDLLAAGGSLVVKQEYGSGGPNWPARIRSAQRCGKLPEGKELVHGWRAGGHEIALQDIPAWKLAVPDPVPVPERLHRPHAIVTALRNGEPATGLSKPVRPRMLRLLQAIGPLRLPEVPAPRAR